MTTERAGDEEEAVLSPQQLASLDDELLATESGTLGRRLTEYLAPPPDLNQRMNGRIKKSLVNRETMLMAADLLSLGWRTTRVVVHPPDGDGVAG